MGEINPDKQLGFCFGLWLLKMLDMPPPAETKISKLNTASGL